MMQVVGYDMAREAANNVYEAAGVGPEDLDVVELHDCFAHNELITYEALGLCPEGGAERSSTTATTPTAARSSPIPPAACCPRAIRSARPGLAQCYELTRQLRGAAAATPGRGRATGAAAQPRPRRRLRGDAVRARREAGHGRSISGRAQLCADHGVRRSKGACAISSTRSSETNPVIAMPRPRARRAIPRRRRRRPICSVWR